MPTPYAAAIIPTHDRASTLSVALASVQAQSVREIEILLVLDGASGPCREIAAAAASADGRVRIIDLPKAPGSGGANVHAAIGSASAPRIFYNDDDDVWLPHHVARLGPLLDHADVADSRVATAGRDGAVHLAPCPNANAGMRRLLAGMRHKTLFDTHIAHTVAAYRRFARWGGDPAGGDQVWHFAGAFAAAKACRWGACPRVTALSLHGANRRDMSAAARAAEIAAWHLRAREGGDAPWPERGAGSAYHLFRLMTDDAPGGEGFEAYLARHGAFEDVAADGLCRALFALWHRAPAEADATRALARLLATPVFVGHVHAKVADLLQRALGLPASLALAEDLAREEGKHRSGALALAALFHLRGGAFEAALAACDRAAATGPDPIGQLPAIRERILALRAEAAGIARAAD